MREQGNFPAPLADAPLAGHNPPVWPVHRRVTFSILPGILWGRVFPPRQPPVGKQARKPVHPLVVLPDFFGIRIQNRVAVLSAASGSIRL